MAKKNKRKKRATRPAGQEKYLLAAGSRQDEVEILCDVTLNAADGGEGDELRRFVMKANTGAPMSFWQYRYPVIVDLKGIAGLKKRFPILREHRRDLIVGHSESAEIVGSDLMIEGVMSGANEDTQEIIETSDNGFPWQSSVGLAITKMLLVPERKTATANGVTATGPVYIARKSKMKETSFVTIGADDKTSALVAHEENILAEQAAERNGKMWKTYEEFLAARGLSSEDLTAAQEQVLRADFDAQLEASGEGGEGGKAKPKPKTIEAADDDPESARKARRELLAADEEAIGEIQAAAKGHPTILASALREDWTIDKVKLEVLKASRDTPPNLGGGSSSNAPTQAGIEAALGLSAGLPEEMLLASLGEKAMDEGSKYGNIGMRDVVVLACQAELGHAPRVWGDGRSYIEAGFSTISLPGILGNTMNKQMVASYQAQSSAWKKFAKKGRVSDFKPATRHRIVGTGAWEKVAAGGELSHGKLDEQNYTIQADTHGQIITITRQMFKNDDLNALLETPGQMGIQAAYTVEAAVIEKLLANTGSFFGTGNSNYTSGASSAFGIDGLTALHTLFRQQKAGPKSKEKDKRPINIVPKTLLVPASLEIPAQQFIGSPSLNLTGSTDAEKGASNPFYNKYEIVSTPMLEDSFFTGYSAAAYYLFADPAVNAAMEVAFVDGMENPVLEQMPAPVNVLGFSWRGYIDFGVNFMDPKGAAKSAGA